MNPNLRVRAVIPRHSSRRAAFQAHWENDEGLCPDCKSDWVNNIRDHADRCKYIAWLNESDDDRKDD